MVTASMREPIPITPQLKEPLQLLAVVPRRTRQPSSSRTTQARANVAERTSRRMPDSRRCRQLRAENGRPSGQPLRSSPRDGVNVRLPVLTDPIRQPSIGCSAGRSRGDCVPV